MSVQNRENNEDIGGSDDDGIDDNDDKDVYDECGDDGFAGGDIFDDVIVMMLVMM